MDYIQATIEEPIPVPVTPEGIQVKEHLLLAICEADVLMGKLIKHLTPLRQCHPRTEDKNEASPSTAEYFRDIHAAACRVNNLSRRLETLIDEIKL